MAAQPQQTLTASNASSKHSALLAGSSSAALPSPHLSSHCSGGRLCCSPDLDSRGGIRGHSAEYPSVSHPTLTSSASSSSFLSSSSSVVPFPLSSFSVSSSSSSSSSTFNSHSQTLKPSSRRARPCSLCGTTALRPQPTYVSTSSYGVLEQPIVLLHRLEDGLPRGDVRSLHAFGTIRLLPVPTTKGHEEDCDTISSEFSGCDGREGELGQAMDDDSEGHTREVYHGQRPKPELKTNGICSEGEETNERPKISDTENGVKSVFLEETYHIEAILEDEVAIGDALHIKGNGTGVEMNNDTNFKRRNEFVSDTKVNDTLGIDINKVESYSDKDVGSDDKRSSEVNHKSMQVVLKRQNNESEKEQFRNSSAGRTESDPSVLLPSCDEIKENSLPNNNQLLTASHFSAHTKCPSVSSNSVSTTSVKALPGFTSSSCTVATSCIQTTKALSYQCSSPVVQNSPDSFIAYSPKLMHSPVYWSPRTTSPNICGSPTLISNSCPSPGMSPAPSPPSPCESPSLPFSPPPSPAPEFIQSDSADALVKGESQNLPLSPYSPGSSPTTPMSPAPHLSPCDSPPSPSASAESLQTSLEDTHATPVEQNDTSETLGIQCTSLENDDNCVTSRESSEVSQSSKNVSGINAQVEQKVKINDKLKPKQINSVNSTGSSASLGLSENLAFDDSERGHKSTKENSKSNSENSNTENDICPMKIKFRLRSKTETSPDQNLTNNDCNKNGIPKIVLTLTGSGPNKEYSCSNKLSNDDQSSSKEVHTYRKHKSKKDKREKERHKTRKTLRVNKYKRHLELFGEDSNDSIGIESCENKELDNKCNDQSRNPETSKDAESPVVFPALDCLPDLETVPSPKGRDGMPKSHKTSTVLKEDVIQARTPAFKKKTGFQRNRVKRQILAKKRLLSRKKTQGKGFKKWHQTRNEFRIKALKSKEQLEGDSAKSKRRSERDHIKGKKRSDEYHAKSKEHLDEHHVVSDGSSKVLGRCQLLSGKPALLLNEEKIVPSSEFHEPVSIKTEVSVKDEEIERIPDLFSGVKKEKDNSCENDYAPQKEQEESPVRAQPERTTKNCDAGRDSDSCLWVSFGVNRPIPLPANDLPNLEPEPDISPTNTSGHNHFEEKREIQDLLKTSANDLQVRDSKTDAEKSVGATSPTHDKSRTDDPEEPLSPPSTDQEKNQSLDEEFSMKEDKYSKPDNILTKSIARREKSEGTKENIPDQLPVSAPIKDSIAKPHIRLRSAPKPMSKAMEQIQSNLQMSENLSKCAKVSKTFASKDKSEKQMLGNCGNSSKSILPSLHNPESDTFQKENSKYSEKSTVDSGKGNSHESEDDQYYQPRKLQKVPTENVKEILCSKDQPDASLPKETDSEKSSNNTSNQLVDEEYNNSSANNDAFCQGDQQSSDEVTGSSETQATLLNASRRDQATPKPSTNNNEGSLVNTDENEQNGKITTSLSHNPEFSKVLPGHLRKKRKYTRRKHDAGSSRKDKSVSDESSSEAVTKDNSPLCKESSSSKGGMSVRKDREEGKKHRKPRKKEDSGSGTGKTSVIEAIQQTLEVKHVEERELRIVQEFPKHNWLEAKLKNKDNTGSLCSFSPSKRPPPPLLPQSSSVPVTSSLQLSTPPSPTTPLKKKEELPSRRNSFAGWSSVGGLKGHLQTAVPPLLPSYRVTALPKRTKLSPPCSSASVSGGSTVMSTSISSSSSVLIQENLDTNMGVFYGPVPTSGTTPTSQETGNAPRYSSPESDKATLYSITDSNTATVYGVSNPHLEVLFEDPANPNSHSKFDQSLKNISISFQHVPLTPESEVTCNNNNLPASLVKDGNGINSQSTVMSNSNVCVATGLTSDAKTSASLPSPNTSQMADFLITHEPITNTCVSDVSLESNSTTKEIAISDAIETEGTGSPQQTSSTSPSIPVFSQKHVLLKRAFMDMMKDTESLPESPIEVKVQISPKLYIDETPSQGDQTVKSVASHANDVAKKFTQDTSNTEDNILQLPRICENSLKKQKEEKVLHGVSNNSKETIVKPVTNTGLSESETNSSGEIKSSGKTESNSETVADAETKCSGKTESNTEATTNDETKSNGEEKNKDEAKSSSEMHPAILFSMLYEELQRTRQEVERLRKQQELMLTEKNDKTEAKDVKTEPPPKDEVPKKERVMSPKSSSAGNHSDDDFVEIYEEKPTNLVEIYEEKPAKISIRNDLLASGSQVSPADRVSVQTSKLSTTLTNSNVSPKPSISASDVQLVSPLAKNSPSLPQISPKLCQTSPCSPRVSPALTRTSPVVNSFVNHVAHISYPATVQASEVSNVQPVLPLPRTSPTVSLPLPHTSPTASHINVVSLYSTSGAVRTSPVLPRNSPIISRQSPSSSSSPAVPKSSPALPKSSPVAPLCSPHSSKEATVFDVTSESVRAKYRINTEVEVMPVSTGNKPHLSEPQPRTYMEVIDSQKAQDTPLLLEAVKGRRLENSTIMQERERIFSQNSISMAQHLVTDHMKRPMHSQAVESEVKRLRFSTSDLPEFPPSSQKPPPLKPVPSLQRRYSDNMDPRKAEPIMVHFPPSNIQGFPSTSEHGNSATSFPQPRSSIAQNALLAPHTRRCSDGNIERNRDYQQQYNLQHQQYQRQMGPCPPALRSLGPDKATIFPIPPPTSSSGIQPYGKSHTPPSVRSSVIDQHKASLIESSNSGIFPKHKQPFDSQIATATTQERVQSSSGPFEKTRQPQTFAARVLVRDSVPESVPRLPPPPYPSQHYSNCNPHLQSMIPNHHYLNNMHHNTGANLHHLVPGGLIQGGLQSSSLQSSTTNILSHNNTNSRNNTSSGSGDRKICLNCPQPARFLCSGCKKAWYCSENCQRNHWTIHNASCVP